MCTICNAHVSSSGHPAPYDHHLLSVVRPLAARACRDATLAYCRSLHESSSSASSEQIDHTLCKANERALTRKIEEGKVRLTRTFAIYLFI